MRVLIAGGGSGGHIFPAVALIPALRDQEEAIDVLLVGSGRDLDKRILKKEGVPHAFLSANKMPTGFTVRLVPFIFWLMIDLLRGIFLVLSYRPSVIVGFGGYVSLPLIVAGACCCVPNIVHEQNVIPGRANMVLCRFAKKVAVSFSETVRYLSGMREKVVITGNPIRTDITRLSRSEALRRIGLEEGRLTLLIMGGSQGSSNLNRIVVGSIEILGQSVRQGIQIIHLSGRQDFDWLSERYRRIGIPHKVFSFIEDIGQVYSACDLAVSRAGSSALFELAAFAKPMILVPYPYAMQHQSENALAFSKNDAALSAEEKDISPESFRDILERLIMDKERMSVLSKNAYSLSVPDASHRLACEVIALARRAQ